MDQELIKRVNATICQILPTKAGQCMAVATLGYSILKEAEIETTVVVGKAAWRVSTQAGLKTVKSKTMPGASITDMPGISGFGIPVHMNILGRTLEMGAFDPNNLDNSHYHTWLETDDCVIDFVPLERVGQQEWLDQNAKHGLNMVTRRFDFEPDYLVVPKIELKSLKYLINNRKAVGACYYEGFGQLDMEKAEQSVDPQSLFVPF